MTATISIVNYTRYSTEDIRSLAQTIAGCNHGFDDEKISLVVDTYKPSDETAWVNSEAAESGEIRIVAPENMPVPLAERLAILGSEYPTLPAKGKEQIVEAILTAIRRTGSIQGTVWNTPGLPVIYAKRLDDTTTRHGVHDYWDFKRHALHPFVEKSGVEIGINERAPNKKPKVSPKRYDWASKRLSSARQDLWAMAYFSQHRMGSLKDDVAKALDHLDKIAADQKPVLEEWLGRLQEAEEEHRLLLLQLKQELNDVNQNLQEAKALAIGGKNGAN